MLHKLLYRRETGQDHPSVVQRAEATREIFALELSGLKSFEKSTQRAANCLDIETIEGFFLLSGQQDGSICLYDTQTRGDDKPVKFKPYAKIDRGKGRHKNSVTSVSWYPWDTGIFISSSADSTVKVWDTNLLKTACSFDLGHHVYAQAMSPIASSHSLIAATSQNGVVLCDMRSGAATHTLLGHSGDVLTLAWSPREENFLASAGLDGCIKFWDVRRGGHNACLHTLNQHYVGGRSFEERSNSTSTSHNGAVNGLKFNADGLFLLSTGTDSRMRCWDVFRHKNTLVNYGKVKNSVHRNVTFSIASQTDPAVVCVPHGNRIRVCEMLTGDEINVLSGHFDDVTTALLHPIHQELYSAGSNGEILVWSPLLKSRVVDDFQNKPNPALEDDWSD